MNIKLFTAALGLLLTVTAISASAQKTYTEGLVTLSMTMNGQQVQPKYYFRADSTALMFSMGPATIKILQDTKLTWTAVLVDVPVASIKKAAIATPAEIEDALNALPKLTFAPTTETKQISGFNCKKVVATDTKTNKTYDIWVTNDISVPASAFASYYAGAGGFPVQYTSFSMGQTSEATDVSVSDQKVPKGTFAVPADYDKITMEELKSMGGR